MTDRIDTSMGDTDAASTAFEAEDGPRLVTSNDGLVVDKIGKSFRRRPVVRGVSFAVQRGEAVGLLGPNGAGKTTTFYMITGLISPDYGKGWTVATSQICLCIDAPGLGLATCRRRPPSFAVFPWKKTSVPCLK